MCFIASDEHYFSSEVFGTQDSGLDEVAQLPAAEVSTVILLRQLPFLFSFADRAVLFHHLISFRDNADHFQVIEITDMRSGVGLIHLCRCEMIRFAFAVRISMRMHFNSFITAAQHCGTAFVFR